MHRIAVLLAGFAIFASSCHWVVRVTESTGPDNEVPTYESRFALLSSAGRFVAFSSSSPLVADDTNGVSDVYWSDLRTSTVRRLSVNGSGDEVALASRLVDISGNGREVLLASGADLTGDGMGSGTFVANTLDGTLTRVLGPDTRAGSMTDDGSEIAFASALDGIVPGDNNGRTDFFVLDRATGSIDLIPYVNLQGGLLSDNGRYVVFTGYQDDLVPDDTNGSGDVFRYDRENDVVERVSLDAFGGQIDVPNGVFPHGISDDGERVVISAKNDLLQPGGPRPDVSSVEELAFFVRDMAAGTTEQISLDADGERMRASAFRSLSGDGTRAVFVGVGSELFIRDLDARTTSPATIDSDGSALDPLSVRNFSATLSDDGRYLTYLRRADSIFGDSGTRYRLMVARSIPIDVASAVPATVPPSTTTTVTVNGSGFQDGDRVVVFGDGVTAGPTTFISPTELSVSITTTSTSGAVNVRVDSDDWAPGLYGLDSSFGYCEACLTVAP